MNKLYVLKVHLGTMETILRLREPKFIFHGNHTSVLFTASETPNLHCVYQDKVFLPSELHFNKTGWMLL